MSNFLVQEVKLARRGRKQQQGRDTSHHSRFNNGWLGSARSASPKMMPANRVK
jgi:hypothetical protein